MKHLLTFLLISCLCLPIMGQTALSLDNLDSFQSQAGNWQIVGSVLINPDVDIHHEPAPLPEVPTSKKKKKKKKNAMVIVPPAPPKAVTFTPGTGILLNMNDETKKDHLLTTWVHGDIDLELEVMIPQGSNSGIYLQGRYEVQLLDSWGVKNPSFSDIGGIYRNWEEVPGTIYRGKAPLTNPAKAPGLWQKMHIRFQAPRFDASGKKIKNAKFVFVDLNGIRIHNQVEVPLPTGGPIQKDEVEKGPLMIQGDHGPVAIRNIQYSLLADTKASLSGLSWKTYEGAFLGIADFKDMEPTQSGKSPSLTVEVLEAENDYGLIYTGTLEVAETGTYELSLGFTGGAVMELDGKRIVDNQSPTDRRTVRVTLDLEAGKHPVEIYNYKTAGWHPAQLGLWLQKGIASYPAALHSDESFPATTNIRAPIWVNTGNQPRLLRAFLDFKGDRKQRLTHTVGVGDPSGVNYVFDLDRGHIVCAWRGDFVDATPMWNSRGDGSFRPRGSTQYTFVNQPLAVLESEYTPFPTVGSMPEFRVKGYRIDPETQLPIFHHQYRGLDVYNKLLPSPKGTSLTHEITCQNGEAPLGLHYKLAEGASIVQISNGAYAIDDQSYYIKILTDQKAIIRTIAGKKELIVKMSMKPLRYEFVW